MATTKTNDNYPAATLRHFHDAEILKEANAYENALCHYAFSVECAQKTLLYWHNNTTPSRHNMTTDWKNVSPLLQAWKTLDSSLASAVPETPLPSKLQKKHPHRRYERCFHVSTQDIVTAREFAQNMEHVIINMILDGLIHV